MGLLNISISAREVGRSGSGIDLTSDLSGEVTLKELSDFLKRALIQISYDTLLREQAKGFDKNPIVLVDGVKKPVENVRPFGKIEFVSSKVQGVEVILKTYSQILHRSKKITGTYIENNVVTLNGNVIAYDEVALKRWAESNPVVKPGDIFRFVNIVPYARKLERHGVTAQRSNTRRTKSRDKRQRSGPTILAPNGTYYLSYRAVLREFKGNANITFGFILGSELGGGLPSNTKDGKPLRKGYAPSKKRPKNSGPYLYPYIRIVVGERGLV